MLATEIFKVSKIETRLFFERFVVKVAGLLKKYVMIGKKLAELTAGYDPNDFFNVDETGFFILREVKSNLLGKEKEFLLLFFFFSAIASTFIFRSVNIISCLLCHCAL